MHKSRLGVLVIDCHTGDLAEHADFWGAALGYAVGETDDDGKYVSLKGPPDEVRILLQQVDHPSRLHLDIESDDIEAEVARLEGLGAKRLAAIRGWVVMEAPSGQRFCVVKPQRADFADNANVWSSG
jgi:hypothetical protein